MSADTRQIVEGCKGAKGIIQTMFYAEEAENKGIASCAPTQSNEA